MKRGIKGFDMNVGTWLKVGVLAATLLGVGNSAQAALVSCPASFTTTDPKVENLAGDATAASDCQYLTPADPSNVASIGNINAAGFFGTSTWTLNTGNGQVDPSNDQFGTWAISDADFVTYDYMIVFKDGSDTNLIGFLFNEQFENGSWSSPFTNPPFDTNNGRTKDVSHYTIAQRAGVEVPCNPDIEDCGPREVPEPNGIALMSLGMIAAAAVFRRRRSQRLS
jgi:hypothetical protein